MSFSPAQLYQSLAQFPQTQRYWIAFSGGCDSHVLLHAMAALKTELSGIQINAVHINHGLQAQANDWQQHCQSICEELSIPLQIIQVNAKAAKGQSQEEVARKTRYEAFKDVVQKGDVMLLAHHQDDQAETLLLQLLRGAGMKGLAAMPVCTDFAGGWLARPLLDFTRADIENYAEQNGLHWINDPSNRDQKYDRNFLRHSIMPVLQQRWPSVAATLSRSSTHLAEGADLLQQLAQQDWQNQQATDQRLAVKALRNLDIARRRNLLRYWLVEVCGLSCPDTKHLNRIVHEVLPAGPDSNPVVSWTGGEVRRYRGLLYAFEPQVAASNTMMWQWDVQQPLNLQHQQLVSQLESGKGLSLDIRNKPVTVRYRQGGEVCKPVGRGHHHSLKNLFQEWGVPPWQRANVPLIYAGDEIAQVVGYCICDPYQTVATQQGLVVSVENKQHPDH
ncbi:MAG: tRNA lysidine(34) synthetase TilS [Gammaproteobacteria bacterium]|nr:tRNA lysidine(34) synthetase TilS [Gammaproteobacteria bacterium]MDH5777878.1 tRNA lysidine(34) synthetase TilS [Gammaproteobacteria bacterium]